MMRPLPDAIIIGAQKAGSTSLHHYLAEHPDTRASLRKEVQFFDVPERYRGGERWYRAQFPVVPPWERTAIAFESTPNYLFHPWVADRIRRTLPNARLVAVLRNPTDRAISAYFHQYRKGRETLGIREAFAAEDGRVSAAIDRGEFDDPMIRHFAYRRRGHYAEQLERFYALFPPDQILVLRSEDLFAEPDRASHDLTTFLGLAPMPAHVPFPWLNTGGSTRDRHAVPQVLRDELDAYYAPHNQRLERLMGRPFGWPT